MKGNTGENLLRLLESRLDNVVFRMGFGSTRAEARQLVSHKSILVNGRTVNIPSCLLSPADKVAVAPRAKNQLRIRSSLDLAAQRAQLTWITVDQTNLEGCIKQLPARDDLGADVNEHLIVELYSK